MTRIFPHKQALLDHQRAKHYGAHTNVKPDWYRDNGSGNDQKIQSHTSSNESSTFEEKSEAARLYGSCPICNHPYYTEVDSLRHDLEFIPSSSEAAIKHMAQLQEKDDGTMVQLMMKKCESNSYCSQYKCSYCFKIFRELRAQRQHENFCSAT